MARQLELPLEDEGEARTGQRSGEAPTAARESRRAGTDRLMEEVVEPGNVLAALQRVRQNQGRPGVDGMTVDELPRYLAAHWDTVRAHLLAGTYQPSPVRAVEIPKASGGVRTLGIPTVLDRLIQQSLLQVLQPRFDPTFSEHSYGFRPGRSAHQAVRAAQRHVQDGKRIVVDADLEQFFDRVNHDVLMGRLEQRLADRRLLSLIRRYLSAGMMQQGLVRERNEGTPQGSPLSPLLTNVLLDEVDRALEARGLAFVRYADDLNIYVRSWRAGQDAMETLRRLYGRLRLRLNEQKSAVARVWSRTFLGYSFWPAPGRTVKPRIGSEALNAMKRRIRAITARNGGRSITVVIAEVRNYLTGWKAYFQLAETPHILGECDAWIRHRLRALQLKQWKRGSVIYRELRRLGAPEWMARATAAGGRRWWFTAAVGLNSALPARYYDRIRVPRLGPGPSTF